MRRTALSVTAVILCLTLAGCGRLCSKTRESLTQWFTEHRETLEKAVIKPQADGSVRIDRELADQWNRLFTDGRLKHVSCNPETGDIALHFNGVSTVPEGDQYLVWSVQPIGEIAPLLPDDPGTPEEKTETRLYFTGIGVGGRGYVLVEQIAENWYYVEYCFPT